MSYNFALTPELRTKLKPYLEGMFPAQRAFFDDTERRIAALCTRRAGKTEAECLKLLSFADDNPGGASVYISLTKGHARRNLSKKFRRYRKKFKLPIREGERDGQLIWFHKNGHEIWLAGCKDKSEIEKFRGEDQGYGLAIVDEGQSYPIPAKLKIDDVEANRDLLDVLINDALDPALMDTDGQLIVTGTPGPLPRGFFWELTTGEGESPGWKTHHWSVFDNPYMPHARRWLEAKMERNGWDWDNPTVRREYKGEWVADRSALVYEFDAAKNGWIPDTGVEQRPCWTALPGAPQEWSLVLGIDLGHEDATAFVLTATRRGFPHVWVLRAWGGSEMTTAQRSGEYFRLKHQLEGSGFVLGKTVVDIGGLGKAMAHDMTIMAGIPCEPAEKKNKASAIRRVRDAMSGGLLLFNTFECGPLLAEMSVLPWNDDRTGHHDGYSDHWCDALLYANREHITWELWEETPPEPGTPEAFNQEMQDYKEQLFSDMLKEGGKTGSEAW